MTILWVVALLVLVLNLPFGFWRAGVEKFGWRWFVAVHAPVPLVIGLRVWAGVGWGLSTVPVLVGGYFAGQFLGGRLRTWSRRRARNDASARATRVRWIPVAIVVVGLAVAPAYVRAYRVHGASEAPTFRVGDLIVVNKAAYDLRVPYTGMSLSAWSSPRAGDVVLLQMPDRPYVVFRRIVAGAGDVVEIRDSRLTVNGISASYEALDPEAFAGLAEENLIGSIVEIERGHGPPHPVTYTPGSCNRSTHGPVTVPPGHFFSLGDNRDHCRDSRYYGPLPREWIVGKVVGVLSQAG